MLLLSLLLTSLSLFGARQNAMVLHQGKNFYVHAGNEIHPVQRCDVDKSIRDLTPQQLSRFCAQGYLTVKKHADKSYGIQAHGRLNGGGPAGATAGVIIGKGTVYALGHGSIWAISAIVGACTGGWGFAPTQLFLTGVLSAPIEAASNAAAVAAGVTGAVLTGPV